MTLALTGNYVKEPKIMSAKVVSKFRGSFVALKKRFADRLAARNEQTITTAEFEAALTELPTDGDE